VFGRLTQAEVRKRRGDAVHLALGHPQVAANRFQRFARQPAKGILHVVQRRQQVRPSARIRPNTFGEFVGDGHKRGLCRISIWRFPLPSKDLDRFPRRNRYRR
jgi:hypothetical protein